MEKFKNPLVRCLRHLPVSDRHLETDLNALRISAITCLDNILLDTSPEFQAI